MGTDNYLAPLAKPFARCKLIPPQATGAYLLPLRLPAPAEILIPSILPPGNTPG